MLCQGSVLLARETNLKKPPSVFAEGGFLLVGPQGLEPRLAEPESAVLPLDDGPMTHYAPVSRRAGILRWWGDCQSLRPGRFAFRKGMNKKPQLGFGLIYVMVN